MAWRYSWDDEKCSLALNKVLRATLLGVHAMSKQEMLSLRDAANQAGLSESAIKKQIRNGHIKGEKRNYLLWDEWYVSADDIDRLRVQRKMAGKSLVSATAIAALLEPEIVLADVPKIEGDSPEDAAWLTKYRHSVKAVAEEFFRPLLERLEVQAMLLEEKDRLIEEQAIKLRLLPDLEKRAQEQKLIFAEKEKEALALKESLEAEEKLRAQIELQKTEAEQELANQRAKKQEMALEIAALESQIVELKRPWWKKLFS
jgi:hypothetical protein